MLPHRGRSAARGKGRGRYRPRGPGRGRDEPREREGQSRIEKKIKRCQVRLYELQLKKFEETFEAEAGAGPAPPSPSAGAAGRPGPGWRRRAPSLASCSATTTADEEPALVQPPPTPRLVQPRRGSPRAKSAAIKGSVGRATWLREQAAEPEPSEDSSDSYSDVVEDNEPAPKATNTPQATAAVASAPAESASAAAAAPVARAPEVSLKKAAEVSHKKPDRAPPAAAAGCRRSSGPPPPPPDPRRPRVIRGGAPGLRRRSLGAVARATARGEPGALPRTSGVPGAALAATRRCPPGPRRPPRTIFPRCSGDAPSSAACRSGVMSPTSTRSRTSTSSGLP